MRILTLSILASIIIFAPEVHAKSVTPPKEEALPKDFSIVHQSWDVGVIPKTTDIVEIKKDAKEGSYFLVLRQHVTPVDDQPEQNNIWGKKLLTDAQCMAIYKEALKLGFFDLKDEYEPDEIESGGGAESLAITANGKTKTVKAFNTEVEVIKALLSKIRSLM